VSPAVGGVGDRSTDAPASASPTGRSAASGAESVSQRSSYPLWSQHQRIHSRLRTVKSHTARALAVLRPVGAGGAVTTVRLGTRQGLVTGSDKTTWRVTWPAGGQPTAWGTSRARAAA
jgi:hypothetical protein